MFPRESGKINLGTVVPLELSKQPRLIYSLSTKTKLVRSFNFTFRYIDDVLLLNNSRFDDFVDRIYLIELGIKDTTVTDRSASYLDLHLEVDSERPLKNEI